jgi:hypothetical protein
VTDYAPVIAPIGWNNTYSAAFCTLLSVCAAAQVVQVLQPAGLSAFTVVSPDGNLQSRAARLLQRELIARLNTGSLDHTGDQFDALVSTASDPRGQSNADAFASRGAAVSYHGNAINRFSVPVPRANGVIDTSGLFNQDFARSVYVSELAAVMRQVTQLTDDVAKQAALNAAQDPTAAATVAAARASSRAAYVTQLQTAYPSRGYA